MRSGRRCRKSNAFPAAPVLPGILLLLLAAAVLYFQPGGGGTEEPPAAQPAAPDPEPTPESEPEPEPGPAERLLAGMTLREKVCQLFVVFPEDVAGASGTGTVEEGLAQYPVGGLIYDRTHLKSREQAVTMLAGVQAHAAIPLLLTCDEEGGRVNRLMGTIGTTCIGPMLRYKDQGTEKAAENAATIASDMRSIGFNMDLAPVADVWSNRANTVIGDRAYSDDFAQAAELVAAAVEGFHEGGVACTLKHFPGHGDTSADSHYGAVYINKTLDQLREAELLPFRAGILAGADAVMMGHLTVREADERPALLSYRLVTELLRQELGFDGVVITDSLQMQAITDHYTSAEIAVGAMQAGVDLLLCPDDLASAVGALLSAAESGELPEERLDGSVLRVLRMKEARGILTAIL